MIGSSWDGSECRGRSGPVGRERAARSHPALPFLGARPAPGPPHSVLEDILIRPVHKTCFSRTSCLVSISFKRPSCVHYTRLLSLNWNLASQTSDTRSMSPCFQLHLLARCPSSFSSQLITIHFLPHSFLMKHQHHRPSRCICAFSVYFEYDCCQRRSSVWM